jgi:hypothetical protein
MIDADIGTLSYEWITNLLKLGCEFYEIHGKKESPPLGLLGQAEI